MRKSFSIIYFCYCCHAIYCTISLQKSGGGGLGVTLLVSHKHQKGTLKWNLNCFTVNSILSERQ